MYNKIENTFIQFHSIDSFQLEEISIRRIGFSIDENSNSTYRDLNQSTRQSSFTRRIMEAAWINNRRRIDHCSHES